MKSFFQNLSLAKKVIGVIALTTLIATITVIPVVSFTLKNGMQSQRHRHLVGVKNLVKRLIEDNRRAVKNYALLFSSDRQIKDNLYYFAELAGERIHPLNAIQHLVATFDLQFVELGDRDGHVVANALFPDRYDQDKSHDILIKTALQGNAVTGIEKHQEGFLLKAVAPIYHDESQLIGTISIGMLMNNDFARMIKSLSGVEILIVEKDGRIVASTHEHPLPEKALQPFTGSVAIGLKRYQVMRLPFDDSAGLPLGAVFIMAEDRVSPVLKAANRNVVLVLVGVAVLSIMVTVLVLRLVLAPVNELRQGAEKIGSGKFDHRIAVTASDEIGNLAEVFNQMASNLQKMRAVEEKLKHAERLASIGEFTAATAHELNNPIANILGLLKVMRRESAKNTIFTDDLDVVIKEANRCGAIVRDLLMYSRSSRPRKEKTDICRLVEDSLKGIGGRYRKGKDISVLFEKPEKKIFALVDPNQFEQVLRNVLVNAFQAIKTKGQIVVGIVEDAAQGIKITFSDSGCGIPMQDLDKIFYPFFTTKKSGEGTGLGLAVCYTIIQSHNGDITVTSEEGKGSTFTLTVPSGEKDVS